MTSTTAMDGGHADELLPPKRLDVLRELKTLKARDGITTGKVRTKGPNLQRLDISRDELLRTGGESADLPIATVKALHCVVESYHRQENEVQGMDDQRWVVLRHELNLDQAFGFDLGQRQDLAKDILRIGDDEYKKRSTAVFEWYSWDIVQLIESKCRPPGEWEKREALRIINLTSKKEQYDEVYNLLRLSPIARRDRTALTMSVARGMPKFFNVLERIIDRVDAYDMAQMAIHSVGKLIYDVIIRTYDVTETLIPWRVLSTFVMNQDWSTASEYFAAASELESMLVERELNTLSVEDRNKYNETTYLFLDQERSAITPIFSDALEASIRLLAKFVVSVDLQYEWALDKRQVSSDSIRWYDQYYFSIANKTDLSYYKTLLIEYSDSEDESGE